MHNSLKWNQKPCSPWIFQHNRIQNVLEYDDETTEIIDINNLKIINTKIAIENNKEIMLSALYRSHDIKKTEFVINLKKLIEHNKKY